MDLLRAALALRYLPYSAAVAASTILLGLSWWDPS